MKQVVLGLDGGGTSTRAVCVDTSGQVLARAMGLGTHPGKNPGVAARHYREVVTDVLGRAGLDGDAVAGVCLGLAGSDEPGQGAAIAAHPDVPVPALVVNDTVACWAGAFARRPGVIAIAGSGSAVFGRTETGRDMHNADLGHYANASARHLARDLVQRLAAAQAPDLMLRDDVCRALGVPVEGLWDECRHRAGLTDAEFHHRYGPLGPLVTAAAAQGREPAVAAVAQGAGQLAVGIALVAGAFAGPSVPVVLDGSVARAPAFTEALAGALGRLAPRCLLQAPAMPAEGGAALLALRALQGEQPHVERELAAGFSA